MKTELSQKIFIPDGIEETVALPRTTHLAIGAHQDDLEFMAMHGILQCYQKKDQWFGGIICTDGAGSSRTGHYENYSNEEMVAVRTQEQKKAAIVGEYSFIAQLGHPSSQVKDSKKRDILVDELTQILERTRPEIIYAHNPYDKHATHVGVFQATVEAALRLPPNMRPKHLWGCEVWRGLDWMTDKRKILLDVSDRPHLSSALNGIFDSQIAGGKRYDQAVEGRRKANATFLDAFQTDDATSVSYAVDCGNCLSMDIETFRRGAWLDEEIKHFQNEVNSTWQNTIG